MICPSCGLTLPDTSIACLRCGSYFQTLSEIESSHQLPPLKIKRATDKSSRWLMPLVLCTLALAGMATGLWAYQHHGFSPTSGTSWRTSTDTSLPYTFEYPADWQVIPLDSLHGGEPESSVELEKTDDAFMVLGLDSSDSTFTPDTDFQTTDPLTTVISHQQFTVQNFQARQLEKSIDNSLYSIRTEIITSRGVYTVRMTVQFGGRGGKNETQVPYYRGLYEHILTSFVPQ